MFTRAILNKTDYFRYRNVNQFYTDALITYLGSLSLFETWGKKTENFGLQHPQRLNDKLICMRRKYRRTSLHKINIIIIVMFNSFITECITMFYVGGLYTNT